jgi:DNA-binding NtrC family response regulator
MIRVLIVDDEVQLVEAFRKQLTMEGMAVTPASSAYEALSILKTETFDVCVLDIKLPDLDGVELLLKAKQMEPSMEIIMLTGFASVETAIRSMKLGAYDYLTKPCKISELHKVILKAYEKKILQEKNIVLAEQLHRIGVHDDFVGESSQMRKIKNLISIVAASNMPVLILGETGTGKELAARAIHDLSRRSGNPFVVINSSTLQESIFESELFGYKKGAFTGAQNNKLGLIELANNGTFFVDEVGDMGLTIQAKILRILETGSFLKVGDTKETKVDVRFIFATNNDLKTRIEKGEFRKDLYFRMNAFIINLPALRGKREDIPLLANYFIEKFKKGEKKKRFSPEAIELLKSYDWPGNVRELANVIERSVLLSIDREEIITDDFPEVMQTAGSRVQIARVLKKKDTVLQLAGVEKEYIQNILNFVQGNKSKAAHLLGISRKTLYSKIVKDVKQ